MFIWQVKKLTFYSGRTEVDRRKVGELNTYLERVANMVCTQSPSRGISQMPLTDSVRIVPSCPRELCTADEYHLLQAEAVTLSSKVKLV